MKIIFLIPFIFYSLNAAESIYEKDIKSAMKKYEKKVDQLERELEENKQKERTSLLKIFNKKMPYIFKTGDVDKIKFWSEINEDFKKGIDVKVDDLIAPGDDSIVEYVDEHLGFTGVTNNKNIYKFETKKEHQKSILSMYIKGSMGSNTNGKVVLKDPQNKQHVIYQWKDSDQLDINKPQKITVPIHGLLKEKGNYGIEFLYSGGAQGLDIHKVEILAR